MKANSNCRAQAFLEHAILFLEVVDHIQLMAVDPPSEHHQQQVKRLTQRGHCCRVYRVDSYRGSPRCRAAPFVRRLYNWTIRGLDRHSVARCTPISRSIAADCGRREGVVTGNSIDPGTA